MEGEDHKPQLEYDRGIEYTSQTSNKEFASLKMKF